MKKSFEDKVRELVKTKMKKTGENITEVNVKVKESAGFVKNKIIEVDYYTKK